MMSDLKPTVKQIELYNRLREIAEPHHMYQDQIMAIAEYIDSEYVQKKQYREIVLPFGDIDGAIEKLSKYNDMGELVFINFNGKKLYSDQDDLDSAYKKITGKTKSEYDEAEQVRQEEYDEEKRKHEAAIPDLTKEWIEKGKAVLDEKYHENWIKCVPIRLGDLYRGMELKSCLDIVKELNAGCELETAKKIIDGQGHSGMSFGLVCSMVRSFCDRGNEFVDFVK